MKRKGNYRDIEDLNREELKMLDMLERLTTDYEEMSISEKANDDQRWRFTQKWKKYMKELKDYKKEIGIA